MDILNSNILLRREDKLYKAGYINITYDGSYVLYVCGGKKNDLKVGKKMTYHSSGTVNYYNSYGKKIIFQEPVSDITRLNYAYGVIYPSLTILEEVDKKYLDKSIVIDIKQCNDILVSYYFIDKLINNYSTLTINLGDINFCVEISYNIKHELSDKEVIFLTPQHGYYENCKIDQYQAHINFCNKIYGNKDLKVITTQNAGELEIVFTVTMRIVPYVKIKFANKNHYIKYGVGTPAFLRIRVYDRKKNQPVPHKDITILKIELNAEIIDFGDLEKEGYFKCKNLHQRRPSL